MPTFRERLLATLRAVEAVLEVNGVLVAGSEVPNLLDLLVRSHRRLSAELRHQVRSNLSILSLLGLRPGMPDPRPQRSTIDALLEHLREP